MEAKFMYVSAVTRKSIQWFKGAQTKSSLRFYVVASFETLKQNVSATNVNLRQYDEIPPLLVHELTCIP